MKELIIVGNKNFKFNKNKFCHREGGRDVKELIIVGNYFCASRSFQIIHSGVCVCEPELLCKCCCVSVKLCKS